MKQVRSKVERQSVHTFHANFFTFCENFSTSFGNMEMRSSALDKTNKLKLNLLRNNMLPPQIRHFSHVLFSDDVGKEFKFKVTF